MQKKKMLHLKLIIICYSNNFFVPLHPSIKSSHPQGWTRQPSIRSHGGQYDVEATFIHFKNILIYGRNQ